MKKQNYMATLEPELQLVLLLGRTKLNPGIHPRIDRLLQTGLDWGRFLELAHFHRLYPLIYPAVRKLNDSRIPPEVLQKLRQDCHVNQLRQLRLAGELTRLAGLIAAEGLTLISLKGPFFAQQLFGDMGLRASRDLDLLVKEEEFDRVEELLFGDGYQLVEHPEAVDLKHMDKRIHHHAYRHPQKGILVELHYRFSFFELDLNCGELIRRARKCEFNRSALYTLSPEDEILFLVMHGARHAWMRLRWLSDIVEILEQPGYCNWETLVGRARTYRVEYLLGQAVCLVERFYGIAAIPPRLISLVFHANIHARPRSGTNRNENYLSQRRGGTAVENKMPTAQNTSAFRLMPHACLYSKSRRLAGLALPFIILGLNTPFDVGSPLYWQGKHYYFSLIGRPRLRLHYLIRGFHRVCLKKIRGLRQAVHHE
jgi:hypothetical protein